ncbi:MAG: IS1595 family transposase [Chthoniobacter sp.]|nr:IS1595 family transposase [Chthoniobacter sp.]
MQADKPFPEALTLDNILVNFGTDEKARTFLEEWLWENGPTCPRCHSNSPATVYLMTGKSTRPGLYNCRDCRRQFTVTVGTIFEDSHIPLRKWLVAWFLMCSSKKGMSSLQMQRILDLGSYRTALFMTHRIRHALKEISHGEQLDGVIEMDETYVGGKVPPFGKTRRGRPGPDSHKVPVVSLVQRDGSKRSMVMERVTSANLKAAVVEHVKEGSKVMSDGFPAYRNIAGAHTHHSVNHSAGEYVRKEDDFTVHTNTVESSFSLLKRGIIGTFHNISKKHLPLYLAEFDFRWNQRKVTDGERTVAALGKARGKRLTYKAIKA